MSRVAEILMEEARLRGQGIQQQGALIGQGIAQAAAVPLQLQQVQHQQAADAMKQRLQEQDLQLGEEKLRSFADARNIEALTAATVKKHMKMNPATGQQEPDQAAIMADLSQQSPKAAAAYAELGTRVETFHYNMQEHDIKARQQQIDHAKDILGGILQLPEADQPAAFASYRGTLGGYAADHPLLQNLPQSADPPTIKRLHDGLSSDSDRLTTALKESEIYKNRAEGDKAKQGQIREVPAGGTLVDVSNIDPTTGQPKVLAAPPATKHFEQKDVLLDGKPSVVSFDPATGKHYDAAMTEIAGGRIKPVPPASMTINPAMMPSGGALDMAAQRYLTTGELPPMGMGSAGAAARVAIMNRAAQIDPQASLAANKATYKADSANLTKLQTTEGTLSAFEKTAGKNLDQFLALADKIPDTGVPWINTPVRQLSAQVVGSENMAAINAARDVALREIARVTNDPKLSGALTDSARAEVLSLVPANATLPQIKAVARVLKQDMANVHAGLNEQIANVKGALGAHPGSTGATPTTGTKIGRFEIVSTQ